MPIYFITFDQSVAQLFIQVPKLFMRPQVTVVKTHAKFGQNLLKCCEDTASYIFAQTSPNWLTHLQTFLPKCSEDDLSQFLMKIGQTV